MIDLERQDDVFVLTMTEGENRWNTSFVRAFAKALDEVEASEGAAALVTRSADEKFFSNGLDLDWISTEGDHPGGDRAVFGAEFMHVMGRIITLSVPTVAAINGHTFGAGFMCALGHDVRIMREDRGFLWRKRTADWYDGPATRGGAVQTQDPGAGVSRDGDLGQAVDRTSSGCCRLRRTSRSALTYSSMLR